MSTLWARRSYLAVLLLALPLMGFRPFTPVPNVCPTCKPPKADQLVLTSGARVRCNVVGQNPDYYIIERLGEHRAVAKTEVSSLEWRPGAGKRELTKHDQVVLNNGIVLHGRIVEHVRGRHFAVQAGTHKHIAWESQVKAAYRAGQAVDFRDPTPSKPSK